MNRRGGIILALLASLWLSTPAVAGRQDTLALDPDVSAYHRFIIYPHLDKGFDAMRRGDRQRAIAEFQQVRQIAPRNVQTAIYLADAYRHFALPELAQATLDEQRRQTPNDRRLLLAQTLLQESSASAAPPTPATAVTPPPEAAAESPYRHLAAAQALSARGDSTALAAYLRSVQPVFPNAIDEQQWLALLNQASQGPADLLNTYRPRFAVNQIYQGEQRALRFSARGDTAAAQRLLDSLPADRLRATRFDLALKTRHLDAAARLALALWHDQGNDAAQLDALSYRLIVAGGQQQAADLLLTAYPFAEAGVARRQLLLERLTRLASAQPALLSAAQRLALERPLDSSALRSLQAQLFVALGDCATAHGLLSDAASPTPANMPANIPANMPVDSPDDNAADDWRRLGDCYRDKSPGLAQYAYARAQQLRPDAYLTRQSAYQAFATHDYASALAAWRALPPAELTLDDLKAAINTALAGHHPEAARGWLDTYAGHGGARDDAYWWRRAQADAGSAPAAEYADLEQAIALRPDARYYARLAILQQKTGRPALAAESLEKAVALESDNPQWLSALAYAYSALNQPAAARINLERAKALRPDDPGLVQQLIYVNQKLGDNDQARRYARQAIDALDRLPAEALTDDEANLRFGLRRLHEDLGRRWRFSVDATSGNVVTPMVNAAQPGSSYRSYMQTEAEYRLGDPAINDGKTLAAYGRVFAGSGAQGKALPFYSPMFAAGLRWKPWRQEIIYLAIEEQAPLDNSAGSRVDTMLRASASFLNGGRFSDDWHATGSGWTAQNLYLDAARYLKGERAALTADYRLSYHHKVAAGQSIEPYAHMQYNLSNPTAVAHYDKDVRAGLGMRWNLWNGGDSYNAAADKTSVGVEIQHAFSTYQNEKNSIFLSLGRRL